MGVDRNPNFIKKARMKYNRQEKLFFHVSNPSESIPINPYGKYHAASMTFVHPTIESRQILQDTFLRIKPSFNSGR